MPCAMYWASQVARVKNPPADAWTAGEGSSIPGWGNPLEKEVATYASIPVWRGVLWTVEPGGL